MINIILAIEQIENDEERALIADIYNEYHQYVFKIAKHIMKNRDDAEDAVGYTFIKIIKYREKFIDIDCNEIKRLIVICTRSVCFNKLRTMNKMPTITINDANIDDDGNFSDMEIQDETDVLSELIKAESKGVLSDAIKKLDEQVQDILEMKYYDNMKNTDIADMTGLTASNVGVLLMRAKAELKKKLEEYFNDRNK